MKHRTHIDHLVMECANNIGMRLADLDAVAVSSRPGIVISLKVGIDKAISLARFYITEFRTFLFLIVLENII